MVGQIQNNPGVAALLFQGVGAGETRGGSGASSPTAANLASLSPGTGALAARLRNAANSPLLAHADKVVKLPDSGAAIQRIRESAARSTAGELLGAA